MTRTFKDLYSKENVTASKAKTAHGCPLKGEWREVKGCK